MSHNWAAMLTLLTPLRRRLRLIEVLLLFHLLLLSLMKGLAALQSSLEVLALQLASLKLEDHSGIHDWNTERSTPIYGLIWIQVRFLLIIIFNLQGSVLIREQ
jgi:hypothetical protein